MRGGQQDRCVAVVTARVHGLRDGARVRQAGGLLDRQRVHVGAQAERAIRRAAPQLAHHAGAADTRRHVIAPLGELAGDQFRGARFSEAQFGMRVDVVANRNEFVLGLAQFGEKLGESLRHSSCSD